MKKFASFLIIAMLLCASVFSVTKVFSSKNTFTDGDILEQVEDSLSENILFRDELYDLMDTVRYISGVRHFGDIYIGNGGDLLLDIEKPTSRIFSVAKNYVLGFAENNQIKPYFMLIPTASSVLQQKIDTFAVRDIYNQRNMINNIYSEFDGKVRTTDVYQVLYYHRNEYIYYHTENLPTSLGGYYIYGELCNRLGIKQNTLENFSVAYTAHGFYGSLASDFLKTHSTSDFISLYEYTGKNDIVLKHIENDGSFSVSESLFVYNENLFDDKTDMIFGGLSPIMEITSTKIIGERNSILVFGDESVKSWLPFLVSNYGTITFVDLDLAEKELLSQISVKNYDQVLFAYSTSSFVSGIDFEKLEFIGQ